MSMTIKEQIIALYREKLTDEEIAARLNIDLDFVSNVIDALPENQ